MKTRLVFLLVAALVLSAALASAQDPPHPTPQPHPHRHDPLAQFMFPPELVMQHQREIGITAEQKTFLRAETQRVTLRFNELQWQLQDAMEGLQGIVKESSVNEPQALAQLEKVLDTEREIKRLHMELAIRTKNKLTVEQQAKLTEIRKTIGMRHGPPPHPGQPGPAPAPPPRPNPVP